MAATAGEQRRQEADLERSAETAERTEAAVLLDQAARDDRQADVAREDERRADADARQADNEPGQNPWLTAGQEPQPTRESPEELRQRAQEADRRSWDSEARSDQSTVEAERLYDSADRRAAEVRALDAKGIDPEVAQNRMHADTAAGKPATLATAGARRSRAPKGTQGRRTRRPGRAQLVSGADAWPEGEVEPVWYRVDLDQVAELVDGYQLWKDDPWYHAVDWQRVVDLLDGVLQDHCRDGVVDGSMEQLVGPVEGALHDRSRGSGRADRMARRDHPVAAAQRWPPDHGHAAPGFRFVPGRCMRGDIGSGIDALPGSGRRPGRPVQLGELPVTQDEVGLRADRPQPLHRQPALDHDRAVAGLVDADHQRRPSVGVPAPGDDEALDWRCQPVLPDHPGVPGAARLGPLPVDLALPMLTA